MSEREDRIARISEAVENEAHFLADEGNYAASNALFQLMQADGETLLRFADIVIQAEAEAGLIP
jgi:hypothetical protein